MRWLRRLLVLSLLVAVWYAGWRFAGENQSLVTVSYVVGEVADVPLWKALLVPFAAGAAVVSIGWLLFALRSGLTKHRYRKALGGLEAEVHQLRNLPLAPDPSGPEGSAVADVPPGGVIRREA